MTTPEERKPRSKRPIILAVVALVAVGATLANDTPGLVKLARCLGTGEGFGYAVMDGSPFQRDYFGYQYSGTVDNLIDIQVYLYGAYEKPVLFAMRDVLKAKRPDGGVAVDVGANVGTHTLFLSRHAQTVHAIEPWPTILGRLEKTLADNKVANVVVHPVGFAAETGSMPFSVPPGFNQGWGSFSNTYAGDHYAGGETIDLPLVVADDYLAERGVSRVDLIKIDIEGFEKPALHGFSKALVRDRPAVFFELNVSNEEGFKSKADFDSTFPENYRFFEVTTDEEFVWRFPGKRLVMCGHEVGRYEFVPFDMNFADDGRNLAAVPAEIAERMGLP